MIALSASVLAKSCYRIGAELRISLSFAFKLFSLLAFAGVYALTQLGLVGNSVPVRPARVGIELGTSYILRGCGLQRSECLLQSALLTDHFD